MAVFEEIPFPNTEETIADRLTEIKPLPIPGPPEWVSETYPRGVGSITTPVPTKALEAEPIEATVQMKPDKGLKAKRFLELVESGMKPGEAAQKLGGSVASFANSEELRNALKKLVHAGRLPAEVRKEMVRSGLNTLFLRNIQGNLKKQRVALEVAKQIAKDPEIGLNMPINMSPTVNIDMGALGAMLQKMKPIEGLENIVDVEDENGTE